MLYYEIPVHQDMTFMFVGLASRSKWCTKSKVVSSRKFIEFALILLQASYLASEIVHIPQPFPVDKPKPIIKRGIVMHIPNATSPRISTSLRTKLVFTPSEWTNPGSVATKFPIGTSICGFHKD